jgi:alpha-1,3-glucosyltransferase
MATNKKKAKTWYIFKLFLCLFAIKLLWMPAYLSTDFEVHRNWWDKTILCKRLAVTFSLPLKDWYYEDTSIWTLDYPPFFAWFEWANAQIAQFIDPKMLQIDASEYKSMETISFQRLSVMLSEIILFYSVNRLTASIQGPSKGALSSEWKSTICTGFLITLATLILANPGILFVDHIHFQYNGMMFGFQILSIAAFFESKYLEGSFWFAVVLNFKHIYLYQVSSFKLRSRPLLTLFIYWLDTVLTTPSHFLFQTL